MTEEEQIATQALLAMYRDRCQALEAQLMQWERFGEMFLDALKPRVTEGQKPQLAGSPAMSTNPALSGRSRPRAGAIRGKQCPQ